ncbi:ArsR/SmtB family transcription factor [Streptomyces narbonensis]
MIRIELDEASLRATRIAISPLRDGSCARPTSRCRTDTLPGRTRSGWGRRARCGARTTGCARCGICSSRERGQVSDFLLPQPFGTVHVREELDALRATDHAFVREQVDVCYPGMADEPFVQPYLKDPEAACAALAEAYAAWWEGAIEPYWPTMRRLVEDEVLVRARTFATEGVDALFAGLETRGRWAPPVLELTKYIDVEYAPGERRLVLVPLVFAEGCRLYSTDDPEVVALSFQARGAAALREQQVSARRRGPARADARPGPRGRLSCASWADR